MELRILGPVEVACDGRLLDVGAAKERLLLVILGLSSGRVVSVERLSEVLWGGFPPESAVSSLRVHVSRLRKALTVGGCGDVLLTRSPGYALHVDEVDAAEFELLVARGRAELAAGDVFVATETLTEALNLWRGPALADVTGAPFALAEAARLEEARLGAVEDRVAAQLACGQHNAVVAELEALVAAHPLREGLWAHRMLALYRCGRQAEALRSFQDVRRILGEQLGITPGPALVRLEAAVLAQDPALDWVEPAAAETSPSGTAAAAGAGTSGAPLGQALTGLPSGVVTFLLTDIEESTALWDLDPHAMSEALQRHDEIIALAVREFGGALLKSRGEGDATLSVFPWASDAVRTAVELTRRLDAEAWPGHLDLRVRMAVHTGEAFERDGDYYGPTVNRAARLRALAVGGQVMVSQAAAEVVTDRLPEGVQLHDLGRHQLRGLTRGEQVYELIVPGLTRPGMPVAETLSPASPSEEPTTDGAASEPHRPPLPGALAAAEGPFVGRWPELIRLRAWWGEAAAGNRRAALIAGEPGIGKTRLTAEVANIAFAEGGLVLYGRCDEDLGVPYQPFVEALRSYVSSCSAAELATRVGRAAPQLGRLLPELVDRFGGVAGATGMSMPTRGEPDAERYLMFEAVVGLVASISRSTPVMLVIDDLQWAARPTLLLLRHLLRSPEPMALFIAAAYRDTELGRDDPLADMLADLRREPGVERLVLGGLDVAGVGAFVEARTARTLDGAGLALARALHTETDGNPFFVGELLRHVVDADGAFVGAATLALPRQLGADALDVPEGVREVIGRRLARLSDVTNRALSAAAAIGPTFSLALLRQVDETVDPEDLLDALDEAVQARLIEEVPGPTGQYAFSHSLVRQALYAEFSAARRARLHRRVGEAIERLYGEDDGRLPALAYHFGEAASVGQTDRAADYGLLAATQALGQLAHEEAAALAERALRALALEDTPDRTRRCPLLLVLAQARIGTADVPGGKEAARQAAADARALGSAQWLSEAAVLRTIVAVGTPDPEVAAICEEALAMLGDQHPGLRARVMASLAYYRTLAESRPDEAAKLAEPALALARETGDLEALAFAMFTRARSLTGVGRTLDKLALADELVALGESTRDDFILAQGLQARAPTLLVVGDVAGFDADAARLADLADRLRSWSFLALTAEWRALRAFMDGRFDDAEPLVGEVLVHGSRSVDYVNVYAAQQFFLYWDRGRVTELLPLVQQAVDDNPTVVTFKAALALIHAKRGDPDSVRPHWEALAANDFAGVPPGVTWTGSAFILTELCALVGDADRARVLYDRIVPYAGKTLTIAFGIYCAGAADRFLGMLALTAGRVALAVDHCEAALALEQRLGSPPLIARSKFWLARSLLARDDPGDQDRARMLLTEAADAAAKLGMAALGEDAGQLLA